MLFVAGGTEGRIEGGRREITMALSSGFNGDGLPDPPL
jgi:hypothetical protein